MPAEGYDYVIAGGGSSGCLAAGHLAEAGARVLLLEAGPDDRSLLLRMPAGYVKLLGVEKYMWFYRSTPQAHLGGRAPIVPQGRVLGGGSSVNAMVYIRGQPADYDRWARETGDDQWSYGSLLPYFAGMEDNNRLNDGFHGVGGPWKVSDQSYVCDLSRAYLLAAQAMGLPFNPDFNGVTQRGVGIYQINARNGRRCSAAEAFLRPAMKSGRITVKTGVLVLSVVLEHGRATAVRYRERGEIREARAASEVVMAAGALATPTILMLSGIGPAGHLARHGIETRVDLPGVGRNLQDHTETPVLAFCNGPHGYFGHDRGWRQLRNGLEYLVNGSGPATSNGVEAGAFLNPDDLSGTPAVQQFCVPSVYLDKDVADVEPTYGLTINSCVARPRSRGAVELASADPTGQALIDPNYLADPEDLRLSVAGVRRAREIMAEEPLRSLIAREVFPGPGVVSEEDLAAHARRFVKTVYHPCGTCRMGTESDPDAVVSTDLRLRGVEGLRVVDASVMPTIISGNTNAAVLVVADKAAEFMLGRPPRPPALAGGPPEPRPPL